jgi:hypothetical protein
MSDLNVIKDLAEEYPVLCLNPDSDSQDVYRRVFLQGEEPADNSLSHYTGDVHDRMETVETPAGPVKVITLGNRKDFTLVMRGFMAAKEGPEALIPDTQGAAMLTVFNWPRIKKHLSQYPESEQAAEFKRFISVKENYTDMLVILSRGPYSNVEANAVGISDEKWLEYSDAIRRYHELTHVICRRLYPDDVDPIRDELIADAVGLYAAFGHFDTKMEEQFLGIRDGQYIGGRLGNYTDDPDKTAVSVNDELARMKAVIEAQTFEDPFDLIPVLMKR